MKTLALFTAGMALFFSSLNGRAQTDTLKITERALHFADSLIQADTYKNWKIYSDGSTSQNWNVYADLTPASVIKYYGGKDGYTQHVQAGRKKTISELEEASPELSMVTLMAGNDQWQCVVRESRYIHREGRKFHVITYLLGHSTDGGEIWRFFDLSYNNVANLIYIFPEINQEMTIPQPSILTPEEEEKAQAVATPPPARKKVHK